MADSTYSAGTISLAAGGLAVTGVLTAFLSQVKPGDTLIKGATWAVIAAVDSNKSLTLEKSWPGPMLTGEADYQILRTGVGWHSAVEINARLAAIIAAIEAGRGFQPDATGTLADRALNDAAPKGFIFWRTDITPFELYVKASATSGDWAGPTSVQGAPGTGGPPGTPGSNGEDGASGADGDDGAAATIGIGDVITLAPGSAATVNNSGTAAAAVLDFGIPAGADGEDGLDGFLPGRRFAFSVATSDADPGPGRIAFNDATAGSVTMLFVDDQTSSGADATAWLDILDDSTNTGNRGSLFLQHGSDIASFAEFVITGPVADGVGYRKVPVALSGASAVFANGDPIVLSFVRTGDKGVDGQGAGDVVGPAGATDGALALFDGPTRKLLKNGAAVPGAFGRVLLEAVDQASAQTSLGLGGYQSLSGKGQANGYAGLDSAGKILASVLPALAITDIFEVGSQAAMLALTAQVGDIAIRTDLSKTFGLAAEPASTLANWKELRTPTDVVQSVAGLTGPIAAAALKTALVLGKGDVGLGAVDNTSDANKPVSAAQALAINARATAAQGAKADTAVQPAQIREKLTSDRTYYVRTDGSDSNTGLANTAGGALLTIQKAWSVVLGLDLAGFSVTISVAAGTYTSGLSVTSWPVGGNVTLSGAGAATILSTAGNAIAASAPGGVLTITNLTVATSAGNGIVATSGAVVTIGTGIVFGACADVQLRAEGGKINIEGDYSITGNASAHWAATVGGVLNGNSKTIALSGTRAFSNAFCATETTGVVNFYAPTFTGAATGKRYSAAQNSVINLYGAGASALPGNSAGTVATGGQYT